METTAVNKNHPRQRFCRRRVRCIDAPLENGGAKIGRLIRTGNGSDCRGYRRICLHLAVAAVDDWRRRGSLRRRWRMRTIRSWGRGWCCLGLSGRRQPHREENEQNATDGCANAKQKLLSDPGAGCLVRVVWCGLSGADCLVRIDWSGSSTRVLSLRYALDRFGYREGWAQRRSYGEHSSCGFKNSKSKRPCQSYSDDSTITFSSWRL